MHIISPMANMRKSASEKEEVISQAFFGEIVTRIKEAGNWAFIRSSDNYEGWVPLDSLYTPEKTYQPTLYTCKLVVPLYAEETIVFGPKFNLPYGIGLKVVGQSTDWFTVEMPYGELLYVRRGHLAEKKTLQKNDLVAFAKEFLDIPYIWGGRSSFGFDCSGYVQTLYLYLGIQLPRDSGPQSRDKRFVDVENLEIGDLIFWGESREKIKHVGLYIGNNQFIHSTAREQMPWVRISSLTDDAWNCGEKAVYPYRLYRRYV